MPSGTTVQVHITPAENGYYVTCIPDQHKQKGQHRAPSATEAEDQHFGVKRYIAKSLAEAQEITNKFLTAAFEENEKKLANLNPSSE